MSIEFFIFSENPDPPGFPVLSAALQKRGWHAMLVDDRSLKEQAQWSPGGSSVYGASDPEVLQRVRELLAKKDEKALGKLFEEDEIGGCGVTATTGFDAKQEYGEGLSGAFPPEVLEPIVNARSHYVVRTASGRGEKAYELQVAVWETLGQLVDGILEDPQMGQYLRMGAEGPELLCGGEAGEGSPVEPLLRYFAAAKAAGFPVEAGMNEDVNLNAEKLSPPDLERLLAFTREHFASQGIEGATLVMMILEEYQKKKGKSFSKDNAAWLEELQQKFAEF